MSAIATPSQNQKKVASILTMQQKTSRKAKIAMKQINTEQGKALNKRNNKLNMSI